LRRVFVAVVPPASSGLSADAGGTVVAALGDNGRGYVLADDSIQGCTPEQWALSRATAKMGSRRCFAPAAVTL